MLVSRAEMSPSLASKPTRPREKGAMRSPRRLLMASHFRPASVNRYQVVVLLSSK
ncbi:MAG: hypothetical protein JNK87_09425 [Bryobacterales bacterium]|nr:hypothetical protein [Bryobacterales bacterium]